MDMPPKPKRSRNAVKGCALLLFYAYFLPAGCLFVPYYNWQYAQSNGFLSWVFFGELVATAKAFAWPYFVLSGAQSSARHFGNSIKYHNSAAEIVNKGRPFEAMSKEDAERMLHFLRKALAEAKAVKIDELNARLPGFGDQYRSKCIRGLEETIHGYENGDIDRSLRGQVLMEQWGDWYLANRGRIQEGR